MGRKNTKQLIMKKILFVFLLLTYTTKSQDLEENTKYKNTISLEFYQPFQNNIREFYNDDWILGYEPSENSNYSRNAFSNAFGISYERILKKNIIFRTRLGFSIREIKEHNSYQEMNPEEDFITLLAKEYNYNQIHINSLIGIAKRINVVNNLDLDFGVEFAFIHYGRADGKYNYNIEQKTISENRFLYNQIIKSNDKIGSIQSIGFGPILKPQYYFSERFVVSAEFQVYFMNTFTKDKTTRTETSQTTFEDGSFENNELIQEINYDVNQWNWTKISPLIRVGYLF